VANTGGNISHVALFNANHKAAVAAYAPDMDIADAAVTAHIVFIRVAAFTALDMQLSAMVARSKPGTAFGIGPIDASRTSHASSAAILKEIAPIRLHR
jgi:hypothetical protein